jgi:hypothetical protein
MEGIQVVTPLSIPSPAPPSAADLDTRLVALLRQPQVSDDELLHAAHDVALAQYADMLLHQQDQRCAAHTARLQAEGWFDPPSASQAADTVTHTNADTVLSARSNPSVSTVVPKEIETVHP